MIKIKNLNDLRKTKIFSLIKFAIPIIDQLYPVNYSPNRKYNNRYFFKCILHFVETNTSWNKYKGTYKYPINEKYLNQIHNKYFPLMEYL
jgi:hypothetical protein